MRAIKGLIEMVRRRNRTRSVDLLFRAVFTRCEQMEESNLALSIELLWRFWSRGQAERARNALEAEYLAMVKEGFQPLLAPIPTDESTTTRRKVS